MTSIKPRDIAEALGLSIATPFGPPMASDLLEYQDGTLYDRNTLPMVVWEPFAAVAALISRAEAADGDTKRLDYAQSLIDPQKQAVNRGHATQTWLMRNNETLRAALDAAMAEQPKEPTNADQR